MTPSKRLAHRPLRGLTLLEVILYIGLFSLILGSYTFMLYDMQKTAERDRVLSILHLEARALEKKVAHLNAYRNDTVATEFYPAEEGVGVGDVLKLGVSDVYPWPAGTGPFPEIQIRYREDEILTIGPVGEDGIALTYLSVTPLSCTNETVFGAETISCITVLSQSHHGTLYYATATLRVR